MTALHCFHALTQKPTSFSQDIELMDGELPMAALNLAAGQFMGEFQSDLVI